VGSTAQDFSFAVLSALASSMRHLVPWCRRASSAESNVKIVLRSLSFVRLIGAESDRAGCVVFALSSLSTAKRFVADRERRRTSYSSRGRAHWITIHLPEDTRLPTTSGIQGIRPGTPPECTSRSGCALVAICPLQVVAVDRLLTPPAPQALQAVSRAATGTGLGKQDAVVVLSVSVSAQLPQKLTHRGSGAWRQARPGLLLPLLLRPGLLLPLLLRLNPS